MFTCQQPADRQVYGDFFLRHLIPECFHAVACQAQADWLLTIWKAVMTVTESAQTLLVGLDQHTLLTHTHTHTKEQRKGLDGSLNQSVYLKLIRLLIQKTKNKL